MQHVAALLLAFCLSGRAAEIPISLVPQDELGSRGQLQFEKMEWSIGSPWFHKPAPVCKVVIQPLDLSLVKKEAERLGMVPEKLTGRKEKGAFSYVSTKPPWVGAGGYPISRYIFFGVAKFDQFERDEHGMAAVKPLATKEQSVAICREWMKKLGIDEGQFYRGGDWAEGFEVDAMTGRESGTHPVTKERVVAEFGQHLRFTQQIGGLPAFWSGFGGNIMFDIADGGEFCGLSGGMRAWEKIGDYEVLDRDGVEAAVKDGFAWTHEPIQCERLEVVKVDLEAYHADWEKPQVDFPLIYSLHCKLHGGPEDGKEKVISLPALKQHRDKYGPPPAAKSSKQGEAPPEDQAK